MLVNKMLHDVARTNLCKGINGLTKKRCCIEASLFLRAIVKTYYFFITATPGSSLPSIHSRKAPPAVEM